jgi:Na+-transporting methylmalonyl-CoA/oxaloacetate decarboxylase gamma subunit
LYVFAILLLLFFVWRGYTEIIVRTVKTWFGPP